MPRAILAIRRYPATLLFALFLFLATLILTAGSLGTVGTGGGDDGDGGSGIGGTGKSGEFGGSGFGGTGGPSPFFTSVDSQSLQNEDETALPASAPAAELTTEIALSLENSALAEETQRNISGAVELPSTPETTIEKPVASVQLAEAPVLDAIPGNRVDTPASGNAVADIAPAEAAPSPPVLANAAVEPQTIPAETMTVAHEAEEETAQETVNRNGIPERIQRPDLPPFQRIRPVERPSLLPSRVQPMRI